MPEKDLTMWQQIAAFAGTIGIVWLSIFKYMGLSKDNAAVKKDNAEFKKEVNKTVNALNTKVEKVTAEVVDIKTGLDHKFTEHRKYVHDNFMDEPTVNANFKRLEESHRSLAEKLMSGMSLNTKKLDKIEDHITNRRTQKIHELDTENKDLKAEIEILRGK